MRRIAALALLVVASGLSVGNADASHSRCPSTHVVLRSKTGVVFTKPGPVRTGYYGCLFSVRKTYRLQQVGEYGLNNLDETTLRMTGRFVAYVQDYGSTGGQVNTISVRDLRTGVVVHQANVSVRGSDWGDQVSKFVLRAGGAVVWTTRTSEDYQHQTVELRAMDGPGQPRLLDQSPAIAPLSLRFSVDRKSVEWRRAGVLHRAAV